MWEKPSWDFNSMDASRWRRAGPSDDLVIQGVKEITSKYSADRHKIDMFSLKIRYKMFKITLYSRCLASVNKRPVTAASPPSFTQPLLVETTRREQWDRGGRGLGRGHQSDNRGIKNESAFRGDPFSRMAAILEENGNFESLGFECFTSLCQSDIGWCDHMLHRHIQHYLKVNSYLSQHRLIECGRNSYKTVLYFFLNQEGPNYMKASLNKHDLPAI